ncbi:MAG: SH3 domain-containing protein [Comamonadaceae bacterium]|nr:MAG: SH3 domain-containing protein [Comamonadaceae bacterium]
MILTKYSLQAAVVTAAMLGLAGAAQAQSEAVLTKRPAQLRDAPGDSSRSLATLALQTPLTRVGERQGGWIKVRMADGSNGWVHMFDVAPVNAPANATVAGNAGTTALRGITSFFTKAGTPPNPSNMPISTVGIRGLGAEDIANAQPNPQAVAMADSARLDAAQARQFAAGAPLVARAVTPLPAPAATSPFTAPTGNPNTSNGGSGGSFAPASNNNLHGGS